MCLEFSKTKINDLMLIKNFVSRDIRGEFVKIFNNNFFNNSDLKIDVKESYYSVNNQFVIRGMHFQRPPNDHSKLVCVPKGEIIDVVIDLRKNSSTYGIYDSFKLSSNNGNSLYIPAGCAHGFMAMTNDTITLYYQSSVYNKASDDGIRYDSFGYDWKINNPIISERDSNFRSFLDFEKINPFK